MPETKTQVKSKVRVGTLIGVFFAGAIMMAALGYTVYKGAYKNEPIIPASVIKKQTQGQDVKDLFPVMFYQNGWPRKISGVPSRTTVGDIDADKRPEIIFGTSENLIYAINDDGSEVPNWPIKIDEYEGLSTPGIADINNDKKLDVVIQTKTAVYVFNGNAEIMTGWPKLLENLSENSPVIGNVTGDIKPEIIVSGSKIIYLLDDSGNIIFSSQKGGDEKISSSVAVGDINNDDLSEIIYTVLANDKNYLHTVTGSNNELAGFPAEINSNSNELEIVIGDVSVSNRNDIVISTKQNDIYVYSNQGKKLMTANFGDGVSDLALGDIDNNGVANISFANSTNIHVLGEFGIDIKGWPRKTDKNIKFINLADIDNDGNSEILGTGNDKIYAWKNNGELIKNSWPLSTESGGGNYLTYPTLADVDNNSVLEIISSLTDDSVYIWNLADLYDKSGIAWWPMKRADVRNTGSL